MSDPNLPDHRTLYTRLDQIDTKLGAIVSQANGDHWRTSQLETQMVRVRRVLWGDEDHGLKSDGGLVGHVRQTRRDIKMLQGLIVFVMPVVMLVLNRLIS